MRKPTLQISEKTRTLILLILLIIAVGFIIWSKQQYSIHFTDTF